MSIPSFGPAPPDTHHHGIQPPQVDGRSTRVYSPLSRAVRAVALPFILPLALCGGRSLVSRNWSIIRQGRIPSQVLAPIIPLTPQQPGSRQGASTSISSNETPPPPNYASFMQLAPADLGDMPPPPDYGSDMSLASLLTGAPPQDDPGIADLVSIEEPPPPDYGVAGETLLTQEVLTSPVNMGFREGHFYVHPLAIERYPAQVLKKLAETNCEFFGIKFLDDNFQTGPGIDASGLSKQFITVLAKSLINKNAIPTSREGIPQLDPSASREEIDSFISLGQLMSAAVSKGFVIGRLLPDLFFGVIKKLSIEPTLSEDLLCLEVARQTASEEQNPSFAQGLRSLIASVESGVLLEGSENVLALVAYDATVDGAKEYLRDLYLPIVKAAKAVYEGFSDSLRTEVSQKTPETISALIQGAPLTAESVIGCFTMGSGVNQVVEEKVQFLKEIIREKFESGDTEWIKKLLVCITGESSIKANTNITFLGCRGALCMAHTCFSQLEIPREYTRNSTDSLETLEGRKSTFLRNLEYTMAETGYTEA